ncbi:MAG: Gfo/Idh/MocA family oxidoreductase [Clostridiales bacterium]|nr:Gfo/Idh/MocA family oxidoreductase [Clostridiales bacterium]
MVNLGIIGCAEIAFRRFMPAALQVEGLTVKTVAEEYAPEKLQLFKDEYGLEGETSFEKLIARDDIDALYIPQPPALHYKWAKRALEAGKHVLVEKPSTTNFTDTTDLVETARKAGLALHENYMFAYHSQINEVKKLIDAGEVGDVRLITAQFGFPMRAQNDFRYNKALGGGALLDAGGYTLKLATILLGEDIKVDAAKLNDLDGFEVDMYGSATVSNGKGVVCNLGFGMDCGYRCSLEVWGSKGRLMTNRIFTAPETLEPTVIIETGEGKKEITLAKDMHFKHSIEHFIAEISSEEERNKVYNAILLQSRLVEDVRSISEK